MFVAPHEFDADVLSVNGIGGNDETLADDVVLFDNRRLASVADSTRLGSDADLSAMDGTALRDLVGQLIEAGTRH
ncbi:MAG TPA: hypothetical protein VNO51_02485 [Ilumatobacteraceae bacterium]|nr:hypothetical protein [Ilumatobacteraceae bacterium]